jgi:outer membrane protein assembly factor BamB
MVQTNARKSMMPMVWGILCLLLALAPAGFAADPGGGAGVKPKASAQDLVGQLADDSYKSRERAQKALIALGADALDAVAAGSKSTDPETRSRCEVILAEIQKNLLVSRTESVKKNIVWRSPLDSAPAGATVVAKGLAMLVDADGILHALDQVTGKQKWHSDVALGRFTSAGPAVDGTTAYLACGSNSGPGRFVVAVDIAGGKVLWQTQEAKGEVSPPAVADGVVYVCGNDGQAPAAQPGGEAAKITGAYFEALDTKGGKSLWKLSLAGLTATRPVVGKGLAFVPGEDLKVHAIDLKTHKEAWASEALKNAATAMRLDGENLLALTSSAMVAMDAGTGKQAWSLDLPAEAVNERVINGMRIKMRVNVMQNGRMVAANGQGHGDRTFCVEDGTVYLNCGQKLWAVDAKSGSKQWEYEAPQDNAQGNPGVNGGRVMIAGGGQIIINGNARMFINGRMFGGGAGQDYQPVVAGSEIYYGAADGLHAVDLRTRQETWVLHTPGAVCTRPAVADGVIYFGVGTAAPAMPQMPRMGGGVQPDAPAEAPAQAEKLPAIYAVRLPTK